MKVLDEKTFIPISSIVILSGIVFSYSIIFFKGDANAKDIDEVKVNQAEYRKDVTELLKGQARLEEKVSAIEKILKEGN